MRQDQWQNTLVIDGEPYGVWDTLGGGAVTASETKYRPGGLAEQVSLGGQDTVENVTLGRLLDKEDWPRMRKLMATRCGKAPVSVSRQPLDEDGNPWGDPIVYRGVLQNVNPGDTDSNATAASVWQVVISTAGGIG